MSTHEITAERGTAFRAGFVLALAMVLSLPGPATADGPNFRVGDVYLLLTDYPSYQDAIVQIDPVTGEYVTIGAFPTGATRTLTYDAFRNRLVYLYSGSTPGLRAMDAAGSITQLAPGIANPTLVAARGDGILYLWYQWGVGFSYLDPADVLHDLLDETGTGRFTLGPGTKLDELIYDLATNSLIGFVGDYTGGYPAQCAQADRSCAVKIPLTADGTQVAAEVTAVQVDVSPSFERPVGSGYAPGNAIFWVVDTNSNDAEPRLQLLDPATMSASTFASNGPYIGAASTTAGTYSSLRGQGIVPHPTAGDLRAFSLGESGDGTSFAAGVLSPQSAPIRMVEIHTAPVGTNVEPDPAAALAPLLEVTSVNPTPSQTRLRFSLPADSFARLTIHDVRGWLVRTLAAGSFPAGDHAATWDGRANDGRPVPAGLYVCTLETGTHLVTRKLVLLR